MKEVSAQIQKLKLEDLIQLERGETLTLSGETISQADVEIRRTAADGHPDVCSHQLVSIEFDPTVTPEQLEEGLAREIIRKIQGSEKEC